VLRRSMTQGVSRRPLTAKVRVRYRARPCEICGGQSGTCRYSRLDTSSFPCQYHSTNAKHSSSTCCSYQTDKRAKTATDTKKQCSCACRWSTGYRKVVSYWFSVL